ncbi:MAG: GGDEF domain-containing protein [Caldimonas sp.]
MSPLKILLLSLPLEPVAAVLAASPFGPFALEVSEPGAAASTAPEGFDAVLLNADAEGQAQALGDRYGATSALLVVTADPQPDATLGWLRRGAQDVLAADELGTPALARRVHAAIERYRIAQDARKAYATDLATGLPHRQQLVEHMSQLIALREREPAPMALLLLRIEGFTTTEARLGVQAADALRRKVGVRVRSAVRASDVVAAIDDVSFAVLLGSILAPADAGRVGAKISKLLMEPFSVGGVAVGVAVAVGIGQYPEDGVQPDDLLRKATGMALDARAQGRAGMVNFEETSGGLPSAANDD